MPITIFSVNGNSYSEQGFVTVSWVNSVSENHYSYRVYRLDPYSAVPILINERTDIAGSYLFNDYNAPGGTVGYKVVEVTAINSVQTEEVRNWINVQLVSTYYWLVHPTDSTKNLILRGVTSESFSDEQEFEVKKLIGRGRKVDVGDNYGKTGSISGTIYGNQTMTAREIRQQLEEAKTTNSYYLLRNPFGDIWKIWFTNPSFERIPGVGTSEYVTMSFDYFEVE